MRGRAETQEQNKTDQEQKERRKEKTV